MKSTIVKYEQDQRKDEAFNLGSSWFDPERSRLDLARMIILHGYPIAMVEHVGFKVFVKNLQPLFDIGRINLAVEMWCSPENSKYVCLTAHYVDDDWKLQKTLNFLTLDSYHTEDMLSEVIIKCLLDWDIDYKLFAMTFDDCLTNDDIVPRIKYRISENRPRLSNGQLLDVRSAAHILNSIAQDAIEALHVVIQKIRGSFRYVKSSQLILVKFNEIAQQHGIKNHKSLVLDCPIRWNSTYMMLETAVEYKNVFHRFPDLDPDLALSDEEWERSSDGFLCSLATKMKAKFDKYWSKCSLALAVAAILDPRFKMKLVEYYYSQIYGSTALERIKEASDGIKELFNAYSICPTLVDQDSASPGSSLPSCSNDTR
ncbi:zinc finger BED domain-containing protein RICESLEEPER 1-like [Hibiscus syriacus]|uniref:zinc finger BED domain-containing protein RICESLEEPER 1-like n=1 Tax=Hibiscus syriacus TaxID=106335 RepID=UPI001920D443|nr:zinc finger BED domain-containing protein RICESLEEPER 1-like [Hibiscus syriacus]